MRDSNYVYGSPVWSVSTNEMMMGVVFWIVMVSIPVYPLIIVASYLATNNITRVLFLALAYIGGYWLLKKVKNSYGLRASILLCFSSWVMLDYFFSSGANKDALFMVEILNNFIAWSLAN